MVRCPTEVELERFLAGALSAEESLSLDRHASGCPACAEWLVEAGRDDALLADAARVAPRLVPSDARLDDDEAPTPERYRVLRRLGGGGMGVVWEAEQKSPRRRVALKVMRAEGITPRALARFAFEAEALARLDHPGIARVYDADVFECRGQRRPFLAMELLEGTTLDRWVSEQQPDRRVRLELFLALCAALEHAHRRGVVHRDLKPTNVLVDSAGSPKVFDFGVARALDAGAGATLTGAGELVGTLPYMSPEQVGVQVNAVDTRVDVHALGLILFELLVGRRAFDFEGLPLAEALRRLREEAPPPLGRFDPRLAGDLEVIVARALEKDPERRTASVAALAADVRAVLDDRPISARPLGALESFVRFARRKRALVIGVASTLAALLLGLVGAAAMLLRARAAEGEALAQEAQALAEAHAADAANGFLVRILGASNGMLDAPDLTVREALAGAEREIALSTLEEPAVEAAIRVALGNTYAALGELERAREHLEVAVDLRRALDGADSLRYAGTLNALGALRYQSGALEEAAQDFRRVLSIYALHPGEREQEAGTTRYNLATIHLVRGELDQAAEQIQASIDAVRPRAADFPAHLGTRLEVASMIASRSGDVPRALELLREALVVVETHLPESDPSVLRLREHLLNALLDTGHTDEAAAIAARRGAPADD